MTPSELTELLSQERMSPLGQAAQEYRMTGRRTHPAVVLEGWTDRDKFVYGKLRLLDLLDGRSYWTRDEVCWMIVNSGCEHSPMYAIALDVICGTEEAAHLNGPMYGGQLSDGRRVQFTFRDLLSLLEK